MPGEFYIENRQEQLDLVQIRNAITELKTGMLAVLDFWSGPVEEVQLGAAAATIALPGVAMEGLPLATFRRAVAMLKFRIVENTAAGANRLDGGTVEGVGQVVQVRQADGSEWVDAIVFVDGQFGLEGQTREAGDVCIGSLDISDAIAGNGSYELRWLLSKAAGDTLNFNDVQAGLRVW